MVVDIPFRPMFKDSMLAGVKVCTCRTRRMGEPGDTFQIFGATFILTNVAYCLLGHVADHYYQKEGFRRPEDFIVCWNDIHPRKTFSAGQMVWLHTFERLPDD